MLLVVRGSCVSAIMRASALFEVTNECSVHCEAGIKYVRHKNVMWTPLIRSNRARAHLFTSVKYAVHLVFLVFYSGTIVALKHGSRLFLCRTCKPSKIFVSICNNIAFILMPGSKKQVSYGYSASAFVGRLIGSACLFGRRLCDLVYMGRV